MFAAALLLASFVVPQSPPDPLWTLLPPGPVPTTAVGSRVATCRVALAPDLDVRLVAAATRGDPVAFPLPSGPRLATLAAPRRVLEVVTYRGSTDQGEALVLARHPDGPLTLTVDDSTWRFALTSLDGRTGILEVFDPLLTPTPCGGTVASTAPVSPANPPDPSSPDPRIPTVVDVAVHYTTAVRNAAGSDAAALTQIVAGVEQTNLGLADSGVAINLRLVHSSHAAYVEVGNVTDLARLRAPSDGHLDELHAARALHGADMVQLIVDAGFFDCGRAYQMVRVSPSFAPDAFGVVSRSCLIGGHTMAHEFGHNMGCQHDPGNASSPASWPFAFGYRTPDDRYRTVMAYSPGVQKNYWSGPRVLYRTWTMGTERHDNVRALTWNRRVVREFTPTRHLEWDRLAVAVGTPTIDARGAVGGAAPLVFTLDHASGPGVLALGLARIDLRLAPDLLLVPAVDAAVPLASGGAPWQIDASVLTGLPSGQDLYAQALFLDPAVPGGLLGTDALHTRIP